jgi:tetrahydromethanopterin S-methyltransferase subunit G
MKETHMSKLYELMEQREQELYDEMEDLASEPEDYNEVVKELTELHKQMDRVWEQDQKIAAQQREPRGAIGVLTDPLPGGD